VPNKNSTRLKIFAIFIAMICAIKSAGAGDLVIHHSIISASTGWSVYASRNNDWKPLLVERSLHSFGIGNEHFLIGTKILEYFSPTLAPQGQADLSILPMYLYLTNGLYSGRSMRKPVLYGFLGVNAWSCKVPTERELDAILHAGAGLKWTFWVGSLNLAGDWRRDYWTMMEQGSRMHGDIFSLKAGVELGGWWTAKDIAQFRKAKCGKPVLAGYIAVGILSTLLLISQLY
jgi:hypothetical protein